MKKSVEVEIIEHAAVIRFVRPEIKNPLSIETLEVLKESFNDANSNLSISKIIFTGSGDTFAAGANLNEVAGLNEKTAVEFGQRGQNLMQEIYNSNKLTIAAINGFCMGGALDLALSCKSRIAHPASIFAHPGASLGIITGWGGTQMLPRLIGKKKALEMFLTAKRIDAREAERIGLVDHVTKNTLAKSLEKF